MDGAATLRTVGSLLTAGTETPGHGAELAIAGAGFQVWLAGGAIGAATGTGGGGTAKVELDAVCGGGVELALAAAVLAVDGVLGAGTGKSGGGCNPLLPAIDGVGEGGGTTAAGTAFLAASAFLVGTSAVLTGT